MSVIGFVQHKNASSTSNVPAQPLPSQKDAVLQFDGGECVALADLLHILLVLGTTGSGKTTSILLPALDSLVQGGSGGVIVDVKGGMAGAVRAIAARHGREADVLEIGPHEGAMPVDLLAGRTAAQVKDLFKALFMSHAVDDTHNMSFHVAGLAQAVDAWQMLSRRCQDCGIPFSLAAFDRILNEPEFALDVFMSFCEASGLTQAEQALARRISGAAAHVIPADSKTVTSKVWREQVTYSMGAIRTGLRLFLESPGLPDRFFAPGGVPLDMERWVYDERKIVVLRLSPVTGEAGAGLARHVLRQFYSAVYSRGLSMPDGQCTFLLADEFQDFISTDPADTFNDAAFLAKVREFKCAVLLGTQSAIALSQRASRGISDVKSILGNCNVRIFLYSDEPETCSLAPETETPLDDLGPGQCVLVHYCAADRTHRHSTTGVNGMHSRLAPVLAGAVRSLDSLALPALDAEDKELRRQNRLASKPSFADKPGFGITHHFAEPLQSAVASFAGHTLKISQQELAASWITMAKRAGWRTPIDMAFKICAACPDGFLGSPDFALYAGIAAGRFTQIDRDHEHLERGVLACTPESVQEAFFDKIKSCTGFDPTSLLIALSYIPPSAFLGFFSEGAWPEGILHLRPFYLGWFLGQAMEGEDGAVTTMGLAGVKERIGELLASHRLPGGGQSLLDETKPELFLPRK